MDAHILSILQSKLPATALTADIVEPSIHLTDNFKGTDLFHMYLFRGVTLRLVSLLLGRPDSQRATGQRATDSRLHCHLFQELL